MENVFRTGVRIALAVVEAIMVHILKKEVSIIAGVAELVTVNDVITVTNLSLGHAKDLTVTNIIKIVCMDVVIWKRVSLKVSMSEIDVTCHEVSVETLNLNVVITKSIIWYGRIFFKYKNFNKRPYFLWFIKFKKKAIGLRCVVLC